MPQKMLAVRELDRDVYSLALERTEHVLELFDTFAVMFSGGKDSTATLQVVLQVAREKGRTPVRVIFVDEEAIPYQTEEYVRRVAAWPDVAMEWYCIPVQHRNACSRKHPYWWPWAPEDRERWVRPMPPEAITELDGFPMEPPSARLSIPDSNPLWFPPERGSAAMFMGIRADESMTRTRAVRRKVHENYIIPSTGSKLDRGNVSKVYPIYDWMDRDVWTAPARFGWDYNRAYDALEMAGLSIHNQRCSPAFGEEPLQKLWTYHHCFPEVWDRMIDRVPGAAAAGRYALTELYAYGGRPAKPDGVSWQDFIVHYLDTHPSKYSRQIAARVRDILRSHFKRTSDVLVIDAPHPITGVSWNFLLMIAMRGDFKNRKQPGFRIATQSLGAWKLDAAGKDADKARMMDRAWRRYTEERDRLEAEGRLDECRV